MPEYTPNAKGPAPAQYKPAATEATGPVRVPLSEVKPEDIAPLAIEYRDGMPVIVVGSGTVLPAGLTAVDRIVGSSCAREVQAGGALRRLLRDGVLVRIESEGNTAEYRLASD
ncbi:hypothetical protein ACFWNT_30175 [Streptomyces sp. NPDC058409]|uniref:hypothetical protein n=1 Tax=Streptomyces sp. NPDC058409 TaxID=3346484 RepID=UPI003651D3F5